MLYEYFKFVDLTHFFRFFNKRLIDEIKMTISQQDEVNEYFEQLS